MKSWFNYFKDDYQKSKETNTISYLDSDEFINTYENWLNSRIVIGKITNLQYLEGVDAVKQARSGMKKMSELL